MRDRDWLDAVDLAPGDFHLRLVYADWLQERDRDDEAGGWRWSATAGRIPDAGRADLFRYDESHPFLPPLSPCLRTTPRPPLSTGWERAKPPVRQATAVVPVEIADVYDGGPEPRRMHWSIPGPRKPHGVAFKSGGWRVLADEGWLWWCRTPSGVLRLLVECWRRLDPAARESLRSWEPPL